MAQIYKLSQIKEALEKIDVIQAIEDGFVAYSRREVVVPPVGEMVFDNPPGECHIKYGFIKNDDFYVIKIASGFYENFKRGLPTNAGLMLLFNQKTGELFCVLLDEGYLTNVRTAAAGAIASKYLAPGKIQRIGIFGAGVQGRLQAEYVSKALECRDITVWGVNEEELKAYKSDMEPRGYNVTTTMDAGEIASTCNLIITATPSREPLLYAGQIRKGTHITAMGSDTEEKQELDVGILRDADIVVVDSIDQSQYRGETFKAKQAGVITNDSIHELGAVIADPGLRRRSDDQITVADLTGVAVQDIQISKAVYNALNR